MMSFHDKFKSFLYNNITLKLHRHEALFNFLRHVYLTFYTNTLLNPEYRIKIWIKRNNRFLNKHRLVPAYFDGKYAYFENEGLKYFYDSSLKLPTPMRRDQSWEENLFSYMLKTLQKAEGDIVVFDVGANIGIHTLKLSKNLPSAKIFSFEPVFHTFSILKKNLKINNLSNVHLFNYAISSKTEKIFMTTDEGTGNHVVSKKSTHSSMVEAITLDDFVKSHDLQTLSLIKVDVEGYELDMLKGAVESIKKFRPTLILEVYSEWAERYNYSPEEIFIFLERLGYTYKLVEKNFVKGNIKNLKKEMQESHNFVFEPKGL